MEAAPIHVATSDDYAERRTVRRSRSPESPDNAYDAALLRAFLGGDETAFTALVHRHGGLVLGIVRRYARDSDQARDLAQRVFLRALQATRRSVARGDVHVRAWLARIAVNLAKNAVRDSARRTQAALAHEREGSSSKAAEVLDAEAGLLLAERERQVSAAVLRLPRRQRQVLALRVDGGLSFREIAQALEIAEGNARVQYHHAMRRLQDALAAAEEES